MGRLLDFFWPRQSDGLLRAARIAAGVAVLALLYLGYSLVVELRATSEDASTGLPSSAGSISTAPASGGSDSLPSAAGYRRWSVPGSHRLLMIPAVGPNGNVWIGEMDAETLTVQAAGGGAPILLTIPSEPNARTMGVTVDAAGAIWMANDGSHTIARYDPETRRYTTYEPPTSGSAPFGIAVDTGNRVWFTELATQRIGMLDPATERFTEFPLPDGAKNPYWLAIAPDGRIWFTTLMSPVVGMLDPRTAAVTILPAPALGEFDGTTGIAVAPDGTVWFGTREGKLGSVDPRSMTVTVRRTPGPTVYGVAVDANGTVWAASTHESVYAFLPVEDQFCPVATGTGAWWVVAGPDGSVWVAESVRGASALGWISPERARSPCAGGGH
jgi:virginiamycin B lyase